MIVWRGIVIDNEMPRSVGDYVDQIMETGCPLGANGGKSGPMRGFQLEVPTILQHELDPFDIAQIVREAGPDSERYNTESDEWRAVCVCEHRRITNSFPVGTQVIPSRVKTVYEAESSVFV